VRIQFAIVEARKVTITCKHFFVLVFWKSHPETVELLAFLALGAGESGNSFSADYMYNICMGIIDELKDAIHDCLATGEILLGYYCIFSGKSEGFALQNKGNEIIKQICMDNTNRKQQKRIFTRSIESLKLISMQLRMYTKNFMLDRSLELDNAVYLYSQLSYILQMKSPSIEQYLMISWTVCVKIWYTISTTAPATILQTKSIPLNSMKRINKDEVAQFLYDIQYLRLYDELVQQCHSSIYKNWQSILSFVSALTYYAGGLPEQASKHAKAAFKLLVGLARLRKGDIITLCMLLDICTIAIQLKDDLFFEKVIIFLDSQFGRMTALPYTTALFLFAKDTALDFSKPDILHMMFDLPREIRNPPPPSPNDTLDTPPGSP